MENIGYIVGSILGGTFPIAFVFGVLFLAFKGQKRLFKDLFDKFESTEALPSKSIRTKIFQYGNNVKVQNTARIVERQDALFIKLPLNKCLKLPLTQIKLVQVKNGAFKSKVIIINFKDESLKPVFITVYAQHLAKFPQLTKNVESEEKIEAHKILNEFEKTTYKTTEKLTNKDGALDLKKLRQSIKRTNPQLATNIKNKAGNIIRGIAAIILVIAGIVFLIAK